MAKMEVTGVSGLDYARDRDTKRSHRYRLWRRTIEVEKAIDQFSVTPVTSILDLGTADGRMLVALKKKYSGVLAVGVEYSRGLVELAKKIKPDLDLIRGDVQTLGIRDSSFDVVVATAVIEHTVNPRSVFQEMFRVLHGKGIFILTAPDPFWEFIASAVGHLKEEGHHNVLSLDQLSALAEETGFKILKKEKFMLSPVGMPFEFAVEKLIRSLGIQFLLANQLMVGTKL